MLLHAKLIASGQESYCIFFLLIKKIYVHCFVGLCYIWVGLCCCICVVLPNREGLFLALDSVTSSVQLCSCSVLVWTSCCSVERYSIVFRCCFCFVLGLVREDARRENDLLWITRGWLVMLIFLPSSYIPTSLIRVAVPSEAITSSFSFSPSFSSKSSPCFTQRAASSSSSPLCSLSPISSSGSRTPGPIPTQSARLHFVFQAMRPSSPLHFLEAI